MRTDLLPVYSLLLLALAGPALAVDGVAEINQTCAVETGCFSGDSAGFPVTISASQSYLLTGNLDVSAQAVPENVTAIDVNTHDVTIDLNGFTIRGTGTTGSGDGINADFWNDVTVKNGVIRGMGDEGIQTDRRARIVDVALIENGGDGVFVDLYSVVRDCVAFANGGTGINANLSVIQGNVAGDNGADGINGNNGSSVTNNSSTLNDGDGIEVRFGSNVLGNTMRGNGGVGLNVPSGTSGYAQNVIETNTGGNVSGSAVQMGTNLCGGNTTCP